MASSNHCPGDSQSRYCGAAAVAMESAGIVFQPPAARFSSAIILQLSEGSNGIAPGGQIARKARIQHLDSRASIQTSSSGVDGTKRVADASTSSGRSISETSRCLHNHAGRPERPESSRGGTGACRAVGVGVPKSRRFRFGLARPSF